MRENRGGGKGETPFVKGANRKRFQYRRLLLLILRVDFQILQDTVSPSSISVALFTVFLPTAFPTNSYRKVTSGLNC
jgi:hypothetical protein